MEERTRGKDFIFGGFLSRRVSNYLRNSRHDDDVSGPPQERHRERQLPVLGASGQREGGKFRVNPQMAYEDGTSRQDVYQNNVRDNQTPLPRVLRDQLGAGEDRCGYPGEDDGGGEQVAPASDLAGRPVIFYSKITVDGYGHHQ